MTDPRWTTEPIIGRREEILVAEEPGFGEVIAVCISRRSGRIVTAPVALGALVAAVRDAARTPELETDAETLRKARELAAQIAARREVLPSRSPEKALLDLLASPAPQGEGT